MAGNSGVYSMAFATVPDIIVGKKLAHGIVQEKLAACVNIIPSITSVDNHPSDCPEVISSKIDDGNEAYLQWIGETVGINGPPSEKKPKLDDS